MRKLLGVSLIVLLSACASQTTQPEVEDLAGGAGTGSGLGGSDLMGSGSGRPGYFSQLQDPNSILSQRSVFYDYDSYTVTSEYRELVLSHAKFLRDHADASVILQGNTDDRGSREYNLALGQRRAEFELLSYLLFLIIFWQLYTICAILRLFVGVKRLDDV